MKPFTSRIRYAPEVASKPDRVAKDLENVKALAIKLEDEATILRQLRIESQSNGEAGSNGLEQGDSHMSDASENNEDPEPKERGSEAVERRVEKIMTELRDQGLIDLSNEKVLEEKRVSDVLHMYFHPVKPILTIIFPDANCS